ncbi:Thioredoxin, mitochondrial [Melipona quadrifasciata]|uniref:Thioredoxin, mitochondrial n=1 Tax=Melipona quadrifasciata TaxID=166423 RepID=A0A0N0BGC6_9HYME|nr:Thioredoxin, mitochondrial [Melipona quadrifasciata]
MDVGRFNIMVIQMLLNVLGIAYLQGSFQSKPNNRSQVTGRVDIIGVLVNTTTPSCLAIKSFFVSSFIEFLAKLMLPAPIGIATISKLVRRARNMTIHPRATIRAGVKVTCMELCFRRFRTAELLQRLSSVDHSLQQLEDLYRFLSTLFVRNFISFHFQRGGRVEQQPRRCRARKRCSGDEDSQDLEDKSWSCCLKETICLGHNGLRHRSTMLRLWCNPCRMLTPRIESVIAEKQGKVLLAKVDIDENSDLALDYEVGSVPVLIAMKDGKVLDRIVGLQDVDKLKQFVDKYSE